MSDVESKFSMHYKKSHIWKLPHLVQLKISAWLKIWQALACKMGHKVILLCQGTSEPPGQQFEFG